MLIQSDLQSLLIYSVMPGVRAPLDARTIRAASASHSRLAISRRWRSNLRFGSLPAHVASLCCISLIIKGLHLIGQVVCTPSSLNCSPSPCGRLSLPRTTTETPPAWWTSGSTPLRHKGSWVFHHAFPRSYAGRQTPLTALSKIPEPALTSDTRLATFAQSIPCRSSSKFMSWHDVIQQRAIHSTTSAQGKYCSRAPS